MKHKTYENWWLLGLILLINVADLQAQEKDSSTKQPAIFSTSYGVQHGFIFAHSKLVQNTKGAHPTGIEFSLGWQRNDAATWDLCNCYPRKGLLLAYYDYDTKILGQSVNAAYFLEPNYKLGNRNFFTLKGAAGFAYLTNPFDSLKNPTNQSYSAALNGYLLFGLGLWFKLSDHWWLNGSVNYQHISNAGLRQPNKGINWPTAGLAIRYQNDTRPYYTGVRSTDKSWNTNPPRWDIALFGIAKKGLDKNGNNKRIPVLGFNLEVAKQVGRINNLTLSTEVFYDKALENQLKHDSIDASATKVGLALGHEFILGKFLFSQQLGVYVYGQPTYDYDRIYHRWGILYRMKQHWGIGCNLLAHRQVAEFIDLRVNYTL